MTFALLVFLSLTDAFLPARGTVTFFREPTVDELVRLAQGRVLAFRLREGMSETELKRVVRGEDPSIVIQGLRVCIRNYSRYGLQVITSEGQVTSYAVFRIGPIQRPK